MNSSVRSDGQSVFLNVPFDARYGRLFMALLAGLSGLGLKPRCVLEVPSGGRNRLDRIHGLIASCGASLHDLSRTGLSGPFRVPRFNMPFELGIAYALAQGSPHNFFVFEEKPYRLQASLSDLNGHDPHIHDGTQIGILRSVLDCFSSPSGGPSLSRLQILTRRLTRIVARLQQEQRLEHPFHPYLFRQAVQAATELALSDNLIRLDVK